MKKYLITICCALVVAIAGYSNVRAGYYVGPNNALYVTANTGVLWVEGKLANNNAELYKKIYVQAGTEGSWSGVGAPAVHEISHTDYRGIFEDDIAFLNPCWKVNAGDSFTCRN